MILSGSPFDRRTTAPITCYCVVSPSSVRRWVVTASVAAGASLFYMACGGEIEEFPGEDGGLYRDGGNRGSDGGPVDPLCTGVVCAPGYTCTNGLCESDAPASGIEGL